MRAVLIYGPPAVGKFTVAKVLSELTGLKLLHNHLIADLVRPIFNHGNPMGREVNKRIRTLIYGTAAKDRLNGIVSTFSYYGDMNAIDSVKEWIEAVRTNGGEIFFVRLFCDQSTLEKRVATPSRIETKKISNVDKLRKVLSEENSCGKIPPDVIESLEIDNTNLAPEEVAAIIMKYCGLSN